MLTFRDHLHLMARYNQWMNAKVIALLKDVPTDTLWQDRGAFFGSVMGTLNHLIVADLIWLNRMTEVRGTDCLTALRDLPRPPFALSDQPCPDMAAYAPLRSRIDDLMLRFIEDVDPDALSKPFSYANVRGQAQTKILGLTLSHVFNHQTHHRGQMTTLLSQMGLDIGVTDLHSLVP